MYRTLNGRKWLDDRVAYLATQVLNRPNHLFSFKIKVINDYLDLLCESNLGNEEKPRVGSLGCYYITALQLGLASKDSTWKQSADNALQSLGFNQKDSILIPINRNDHWVLIVIARRQQKIEIYDSLQGLDFTIAKTVRAHFAEMLDPKIINWPINTAMNIPLQTNSVDCGVFLCQYAKCIASGASFNFKENEMPKIRREMKKQLEAWKSDRQLVSFRAKTAHQMKPNRGDRIIQKSTKLCLASFKTYIYFSRQQPSGSSQWS